jgi:hypothetical protein
MSLARTILVFEGKLVAIRLTYSKLTGVPVIPAGDVSFFTMSIFCVHAHANYNNNKINFKPPAPGAGPAD